MIIFGKIGGMLLLFIMILCINIKDRPIFSYIYDVVSPATRYAQEATEVFFSRSFSQTQIYSRKLFDNSVPKLGDSVDSKLSSRKKIKNEPAERILDEEKAKLDELIKNHQ